MGDGAVHGDTWARRSTVQPLPEARGPGSGKAVIEKTASPLKTQMRQGGRGQGGSERPSETVRWRMQCGGVELTELQQVNGEGAKQGEGGPGS